MSVEGVVEGEFVFMKIEEGRRVTWRERGVRDP